MSSLLQLSLQKQHLQRTVDLGVNQPFLILGKLNLVRETSYPSPINPSSHCQAPPDNTQKFSFVVFITVVKNYSHDCLFKGFLLKETETP